MLATDPETGETRAETVTAEILGNGEKLLVDVTVETDDGNREVITATGGHPFWVPELDAWTDAEELQPGQWLRTSAGTHVQITALTHRTNTGTVHNLTVNNLHTYYVLAGATPVLVHNSNCPTMDLDFASGSGRKLDPKDKRGEFEMAGNALAKHAGRKTNTGQWPIPSGKKNPAAWNALGRDVLDDILTRPGSVTTREYGRIGGVWQDTIDVRLPNGGIGARFSVSGTFSGFLD